MNSSYDVFISYNTLDHAPVTTLAEQLQAQELKIFLDRWHLVPGQPWPERLREVLNDCSAVAICIGPGEMGPWQLREMYFALERQDQQPDFPVIPVLLPGANPSLDFLNQNMWVDFRAGINEPMALSILTAAVGGKTLDASLRERLQETINTICPYRGLHFFREEDASFFFGRDKAIDELQEKLQENNFVALVGASGSGKSSVVRAGLLPQLRKETYKPWEIVTIVPGNRPLYNLAAGLMPLLEPEHGENELLIGIANQAKAFLEDTLQIRDVVERILQKQPGTEHFLLVVDQWEELYTLATAKGQGGDQQQSRQFIDGLLDACDADKMNVVITLRGDFMGKVIAYRRLSDSVQDAQVNLGPMEEEELRKAIEQPANKVDISFEPGLIDALLTDVGEEPGNLPLLEYVLERLWLDENRRGGQFQHQAYRDMDRLSGALAQKADAIFHQQAPEDQLRLRHIMLQLVHPSDDADYTRRRASFDELGENADKLVNQLIEQRLVVSNQDKNRGINTLEVIHEALIRDWPQFQEWLEEDRDFLLWSKRLRNDYEYWQKTKEQLTGQRLEDAQRWLKLRKSEINLQKRKFIKRSVRHSCHQQWLSENREFLLWRECLSRDYRIWKNSKGNTYLTGKPLKEAQHWLKMSPVEINFDKQDFIARSIYHSYLLIAGWSSVIILPLLIVVSFLIWVDKVDLSPQLAWNVLLVNTGIKILQPDLEPEMITIPPDRDCQQQTCEFKMGSSNSEGQSNEQPQHLVKFDKNFKIGKYEVTFDEYQVFSTLIAGDGGCKNKVDGTQHTIGNIRDNSWGKGKRPVINISWDDAQCYALWLSKRTGKSYRLPMEAEWEYAARAGTTTEYHWDAKQDINDFAWFIDNSDDKTHSVGEKKVNKFGLYDTAGNVYEWVQDCWHGNYTGAPIDGSVWEKADKDNCGRRVLRGGSWGNDPGNVRSANRISNTPGYRNYSIGFRLAQDLN